MDTTVTNGTLYYYVVTATDGGAHESAYSNEASATPGAQPTVHVENIDMALEQAGKNWKAVATVLIHDQDSTPRAGATVVGDWLLDDSVIQPSASAVTDATGNALLVSPPKKAKSDQTFIFRVTDVTLSGHLYDPDQDVESEDFIKVP